MFHEVLFASMAAKYNLSKRIVNRDDIELNAIDHDDWEYLNISQKVRTVIDRNISIKHPMKKWYDVTVNDTHPTNFL